MFNFQSDFFKTYELLNEAKDPFYSRNFWAWARDNNYNELCFKIAFKDDLKELGINLDELFDEYDMFKEKSSYGIIKKALEEHPDSWALKALQKVWVMQFKYDAKSGEAIITLVDGQVQSGKHIKELFGYDYEKDAISRLPYEMKKYV